MGARPRKQTVSGVATLAAGLLECTGAEPRVHQVGLAQNQTTVNQVADVRTYKRANESHDTEAKNKGKIESQQAIGESQSTKKGKTKENKRLLAVLISDVSLGSIQTLRLPHLSTAAARRFCTESSVIPAQNDVKRGVKHKKLRRAI